MGYERYEKSSKAILSEINPSYYPKHTELSRCTVTGLTKCKQTLCICVVGGVHGFGGRYEGRV